MGKNRGKAQQKGKDSVMFKTVGTKITKNKKAKPVNMNLKKLKHLAKSKTEEADKTWNDVRQNSATASLTSINKKDNEKDKNAKPSPPNVPHQTAPPDVDMELKRFAAL